MTGSIAAYLAMAAFVSIAAVYVECCVLYAWKPGRFRRQFKDGVSLWVLPQLAVLFAMVVLYVLLFVPGTLVLLIYKKKRMRE